MTAPDPAPSVEDVLAEAICSSHTDAYPDGVQCAACRVAVAAVVAAIRGMSPAQLVELRPDLTVQASLYQPSPLYRIEGPWRAEP